MLRGETGEFASSRGSEPIRVMRLITRLNIGGPALHVHILSEGLDGFGYKTLLVAGRPSSNEGDLTDSLEPQHYERKILGGLKRNIGMFGDVISFLELYKIMREFKPDIVHTHTAKAGFLGRIAAFLTRTPVVIHTFHGHVFHSYFGKFKTRIFVTLERLCARLSNQILCLTPSQKSDLVALRIGNSEKIQVIPLGLDLGRFLKQCRGEGRLRAELGIAADIPLIGFVGRLVSVKNVSLLLASMETIWANEPKAHLVIVGQGELYRELRDQAGRSRLPKQIHFLGWRKDLERIYSDLDVLVCCSKNEGTPVSVIEALASRCPVVATSVGGVPELLKYGEFGTLVAGNDAAELAASILKVLKPSVEMGKQIQGAYEYVKGSLSSERLKNDMAMLYDRLLNSSGTIRGNA